MIRRILRLLGTNAVLLLFASAAWANEKIDRLEIQQTLKQLWESMSSFDFRCEDYAESQMQIESPMKEMTVFDCASATGGKRAFRMTVTAPDGTTTVPIDTREDGRREYRISWVPNIPDVADFVSVRSQHENHRRLMNPILWLIMPDAKPLHTHLAEGAKLERNSGKSQQLTYDLEFIKGGSPVRCELDPERDWLPRRIELVGGNWSLTVTKFIRDNGRWFPGAGYQVGQPNATGGRRLFRIVRLSINRPILPAVFGMPTLTTGTAVSDQVTGTERVVGGRQARDRFRAKYYATKASRSAPTATTESWFYLNRLSSSRSFLSVLAVAGLLVAAAIRFSRARRHS